MPANVFPGTVTFNPATPSEIVDTMTLLGERVTIGPVGEDEMLRLTVAPFVPPNPFRLVTEMTWDESVAPTKTTSVLLLRARSK